MNAIILKVGLTEMYFVIYLLELSSNLTQFAVSEMNPGNVFYKVFSLFIASWKLKLPSFVPLSEVCLFNTTSTISAIVNMNLIILLEFDNSGNINVQTLAGFQTLTAIHFILGFCSCHRGKKLCYVSDHFKMCRIWYLYSLFSFKYNKVHHSFFEYNCCISSW